MKKLFVLFLFGLTLCISTNINAQSSQGKDLGFGIIVGDPAGATLKFWTSHPNAFVIEAGASYFGKLRINFDYLWHFHAINSDIATLYAGPGAALGIGEGSGFWYDGRYVRGSSEVGLGARGVFGANIIPRSTPLEFFLELGLLVAFVPDVGSSVDAAIGMRVYP